MPTNLQENEPSRGGQAWGYAWDIVQGGLPVCHFGDGTPFAQARWVVWHMDTCHEMPWGIGWERQPPSSLPALGKASSSTGGIPLGHHVMVVAAIPAHQLSRHKTLMMYMA